MFEFFAISEETAIFLGILAGLVYTLAELPVGIFFLERKLDLRRGVPLHSVYFGLNPADNYDSFKEHGHILVSRDRIRKKNSQKGNSRQQVYGIFVNDCPSHPEVIPWVLQNNFDVRGTL